MAKKTKNLGGFMKPVNSVPGVLLAAVLLLYIIILYPNMVITRHNYNVGDVVESDIKAAKDFFVEDKDATTVKQKQAIAAVLTVYDHDPDILPETTGRVKKAFTLLRDVYQSYREALNQQPAAATISDEPAAAVLSLQDLINQQEEDFQKALGIPVSKGAYKILTRDEASLEIEVLIVKILAEILDNGVVGNKELLLREGDTGITLRNIKTKSEKPVYKLKRFYGLDQAQTMVRIIGQPLLKGRSYSLRNLVVDYAQQLIHPNITLNRSETEERKKLAAANIKPILYQIKAGEMLLREGERVTAVHLLKLKKSRPPEKTETPVLSSLGAGLIMLCLIIAMFMPQFKAAATGSSKKLNKDLLFIALALVSALVFVRLNIFLISALAKSPPFQLSVSSIIYGLPMAAGAMTVCLFMGLSVAIPFAVVLATGTAAILQNDFGIFLYFLISGIMGGYWLQNCRERKVFIKAGLKLGLLNVLLIIGIDAYRADMADLKMMWDCIFALVGGLGAGVITAGLAPLIEIAFDYTTDIKLLELANLDRPILRRLMIEAPGTYHHSVVVGSLVEAAADEIDANPLLAKVCGYYHDIGKINKPLYFIENQRDGKNRHDKLAPSMSKTILIAHVKDGVAMARENKLGPVIIDTIRQSHGTSLIKYFYIKACEQNPEGSINQDDYRYPGPRPQTREAGLVMLADVVEAASRTLENPTPSRIQGLVQTLINNIFSDGQLDHCELTLKDLHAIAKNFISILTGIHHHRIEYPEKAGKTNGNTKNGHTDRQSTEQSAAKSRQDSKSGPGHLKRLGLP
ncbi:MAG: HDIG domain-containing protein [Desulfobacterales bacterium]|nr:HDIG domain-containing protein [Desulfobacterales bacterium]